MADLDTPARLVYGWLDRPGAEGEPFAFVALPNNVALRAPSQTFVPQDVYLDVLEAQVVSSYAALEVAEQMGKHGELILNAEIRRYFGDGLPADQFAAMRGRRRDRRGR